MLGAASSSELCPTLRFHWPGLLEGDAPTRSGNTGRRQGHLRGLEDGLDREGFPVASERDDLQVYRPFHRRSDMTSL